MYYLNASMELNNKIIGRNLAKFRKMRDIKASDLSERIGMKEATYTKYERGESAITLDIVQKVATALQVDPVTILSASPDNFIESLTNNNSAAPGSGIGNDVEIKGDVISGDPKYMEVLTKQNELLQTLIELLKEKK
jgi:transcriptional regulator with XRE-family HTH domain